MNDSVLLHQSACKLQDYANMPPKYAWQAIATRNTFQELEEVRRSLEELSRREGQAKQRLEEERMRAMERTAEAEVLRQEMMQRDNYAQ